jgi:EAL domain-containing protein (putative c-di-GMP-specific phosphodiesterase class I)
MWRGGNIRGRVLLLFAAATLILLAAGVLETRSLLTSSLFRAAQQEATHEARLAASLGLAGALSAGHLSAHDLRLAATDYAVIRRDIPVTGIVLWRRSGSAVFSAGSGRFDAQRHAMSPIARNALATDKALVASTTDPGVGATVEAAVPLSSRGRHSVVEFLFSRTAVERNLNSAKQRIYLLTAAAALVMFLAILPLLARIARRVPLPPDPARKAALAEMQAALTRGELVVHYQPKIELSGGGVAGVEALVRWNHPGKGLLSPAEFFPVVASSPDLLAALTCQVLDRAVSDCAGWGRDGRELPVAVNVAARALLDQPLAQVVRETLERHNVEPRMLTLELTESALMEPGANVTAPLAELRTLGISVSIDDFGTGYSSLARLRSLPVDELKVDQSLIAGIATNSRDLGITRHIVALGIDLGLRVVAEGVENERTFELLRELGCSAAQGFYMSKPLSEEQLREWLDRSRSGGQPAW